MTNVHAPLSFSLTELPVPLVFATHRVIRDCNEEFARLFGYDRAALMNKSFARLYPAIDDFVRTGKMWRDNLPGGVVYYDERIMAATDGRRFWCRVRGRSHNMDDPFAAAVYCFEPITRPVSTADTVLTGRQRQILTLVAQGKTNAMIAGELGLSRRTIEMHRLRMTRALGLRNSAELLAWFLNSVASVPAPDEGEA